MDLGMYSAIQRSWERADPKGTVCSRFYDMITSTPPQPGLSRESFSGFFSSLTSTQFVGGLLGNLPLSFFPKTEFFWFFFLEITPFHSHILPDYNIVLHSEITIINILGFSWDQHRRPPVSISLEDAEPQSHMQSTGPAA